MRRDLTQYSDLGKLIHTNFLWKLTPPATVADLSKWMGVSAPAIWEWVYGRRKPSDENIKRLYAVLLEHGITTISLDQLYHSAGVETPTTLPWRDLEREINNEVRLPEDVRKTLIKTLREAEERYRTPNAS
jgi:transcriptional regulator with XRE-family HTH domain